MAGLVPAIHFLFDAACKEQVRATSASAAVVRTAASTGMMGGRHDDQEDLVPA